MQRERVAAEKASAYETLDLLEDQTTAVTKGLHSSPSGESSIQKFGLQTNIIEIETLPTTPHTHNTSLIEAITLTLNRTHPTLSTRTSVLPSLCVPASSTGPSLLSLRDTIIHSLTLHNTD